MGVYRYQVEATVIGDVVLGRYETQRLTEGSNFTVEVTAADGTTTTKSVNFTEPAGVLFGYIGDQPGIETAALQPIASAPAGQSTPQKITPIFSGTKGITGQAGAYGPSRFWHTYVPDFTSSSPLTLQLRNIPRAVHYRADFTAKISDNETADFSITSDTPEVDISEIWAKLPTGIVVTVSVQGLDASGAPVPAAAETEETPSHSDPSNEMAANGVSTITFTKTPAFAGPYYESVFGRDDIRERLLAHCRWFRDTASVGPFRQNFIPGNFNAEGGKNYANRPVVGGGIASTMALLATLTDDPEEKAEAIAIASAAANWVLRKTGGPHDLPDFYYKSMFWYTLYAGHAYLDLYQLTKDEHWKEAALRLSRSYAKVQDASGAWPFVYNTYGGGKIGVTTRRGWNGEEPQDAQWNLVGAADFLHWFGRLRTELGTDQFADTEAKAWQWVQDHALQTFIWRRRGGYKNGQYTINNRLPSLLMLYMMDFADQDTVDDNKLRQLWDYCEATAVNWNRDTDNTKFLPHVTEYTAPRFTLQDPGATARYALIYAKLHQRTNNPLDLAKADALAASCYASQEATGLIHDWAKTHEPESIFNRFSDLQNTYPPHIAETGWMLWQLHKLAQSANK